MSEAQDINSATSSHKCGGGGNPLSLTSIGFHFATHCNANQGTRNVQPDAFCEQTDVFESNTCLPLLPLTCLPVLLLLLLLLLLRYAAKCDCSRDPPRIPQLLGELSAQNCQSCSQDQSSKTKTMIAKTVSKKTHTRTELKTIASKNLSFQALPY